MRTLFLKIFLLYWVANVVVFAGMFGIMKWTEPKEFPGPMSGRLSFMLQTYAQAAVDALEQDGTSALREYVDRLQKSTELQMYLFDEQGREMLGQSAPADLQELAAQTMRVGTIQAPPHDRPVRLAVRVVGASGDYCAAAALSPPRGGMPPVPLIALAVTATVVSYWLTRYVTNPVRRLRAATQCLAEGDLTARAGSAMGRRKDVIGELSRDFDVMADRLGELMSAQRRLLRDVSHELRSPLARLNLSLGLAAQKAGPQAQADLDEIEVEAERLNELIGRLLTLSRLETGPEVTERLEVDLAELVSQIASDADFEARSRGCRARVVDCENGTVMGVPELLYSAVENVVRNAVCYTAQGTDVEVSLECRMRGGESEAIIRVRDHGPGIPEAELGEVFRPFYRLADARERQTGGAGLGLAIAQRAVQLHDGSVTAANAAGGGLVVEIRLPVEGGPRGDSMTSTPADAHCS
ncbi:MAG: HAMP domain-containing protein [Phycisphaerae bacterium]|nr:HAMP domain-containing protein [Phycisphaerae bacterium]